jgi:hypothetical protein
MQLTIVQGLGKSPITLDLMYASFPYVSAKGCFQDLNLGDSFTTAPGLMIECLQQQQPSLLVPSKLG